MLNYKAKGTICLGIDDQKSVVLFTPTASSTVEGRQAKRALFLSSGLYDGTPALTMALLTEEQQAALTTALTTALSLTEEQQAALTTALTTALSLTEEQQAALTNDSNNDMVQKRLSNSGNVIVRLPTGAARIDVLTAVTNAGSSLVEVEVSADGEGALTLVGFR